MPSLGIDIGGTSVKVAILHADRIRTARSAEYARPSARALIAAISEALPPEASEARDVGLCVPGRLDASRSRVVQSLNLPSIEGLPLAELISQSIGRPVVTMVASDAYAAAYDFWATHRPAGRLLAISIGTGVGACVLDEGRPLHVSGETPGHFGQIDVSLDPAGAPRTLESYLGSGPLRIRFGADLAGAFASFGPVSEPIRALARGLRIAHAIYRPDTVALLGYVGMQFAACRAVLEACSRDGLSAVAKADWKLECGTTPFHAAIGAARLAAVSPAAPGIDG